MIQIPLYIFLFIYFIFFAVFVGFYLVIIYHIVETASFTFASFFVSFLILALTALTLYGSMELLTGINWQTNVLSFDYGIEGS